MVNDRIYVDACVFVAVAVQEQGRLEASLSTLRAAEHGRVTAVISGLVRGEVTGSGKVRSPQGQGPHIAKGLIAKVDSFFDASHFEYVDLTEPLGRRAASLAAKHALKGPDACHLAMALVSECSYLYTYDSGLLKIAASEAGLTVCEPQLHESRPTLMDIAKEDGIPL